MVHHPQPLTLLLLVPDLDDLISKSSRGEQGAVSGEGHVVHRLGGPDTPETLPDVVGRVLGLLADGELHVTPLACRAAEVSAISTAETDTVTGY